MPKGRNGKYNRLVKKCRERGKGIHTNTNTSLLRRSGLPVDMRIEQNLNYDHQYEYHKRLPEIVTLSKMYENVMGDIKRPFSPLDVAMYTYKCYTYEGYDKNEVVRGMIEYLKQ